MQNHRMYALVLYKQSAILLPLIKCPVASPSLLTLLVPLLALPQATHYVLDGFYLAPAVASCQLSVVSSFWNPDN
jgi:hypothetical protein